MWEVAIECTSRAANAWWLSCSVVATNRLRVGTSPVQNRSRGQLSEETMLRIKLKEFDASAYLDNEEVIA